MTEPLFVKALTAESFEALCDAYKEGMARAFDFQISDKKRNKLRNAVSHMLRFPNGYQQIERSFIEAKTEPLSIADLKRTPDSFRKIASNTMV